MKFRISQRYDYFKNRPIFCVIGTDNQYVGKWHDAMYAACRELKALGEEAEAPCYGWSREDADLWENQYKALLVRDGEFRRLFVFDFRDNLVTGILNYDDPRFYSVVPAARFVLRIGAGALKCHADLLREMEDSAGNINHNEFVRDYLETLWLMLPSDAPIDECHRFRVEG